MFAINPSHIPDREKSVTIHRMRTLLAGLILLMQGKTPCLHHLSCLWKQHINFLSHRLLFFTHWWCYTAAATRSRKDLTAS